MLAGRATHSHRDCKEFTTVKIEIDQDLCEGNLRCMAAAPELFQVNENDKAYLLIENPGEEFRQKAEAAARVCPRQAIRIDGK